MVGWHHWCDGHEFEQAPGVGDGQGGLACCSPWGHNESDKTERLNSNNPTLKQPCLLGINRSCPCCVIILKCFFASCGIFPLPFAQYADCLPSSSSHTILVRSGWQSGVSLASFQGHFYLSLSFGCSGWWSHTILEFLKKKGLVSIPVIVIILSYLFVPISSTSHYTLDLFYLLAPISNTSHYTLNLFVLVWEMFLLKYSCLLNTMSG